MSAQFHLRRCQPAESRELQAWIAARHYTKSAPPGYRYALEFTLGAERIGGMLLGRPTARSLDDHLWLELNRMYFIDATPPHVESRGLALMRRWVRVWAPEVKALLAYSDPEAGHVGTVYLADGWAPWGRSRAGRCGGYGRRDPSSEATDLRLRTPPSAPPPPPEAPPATRRPHRP